MADHRVQLKRQEVRTTLALNTDFCIHISQNVLILIENINTYRLSDFTDGLLKVKLKALVQL